MSAKEVKDDVLYYLAVHFIVRAVYIDIYHFNYIL